MVCIDYSYTYPKEKDVKNAFGSQRAVSSTSFYLTLSHNIILQLKDLWQRFRKKKEKVLDPKPEDKPLENT